MNWEDAIVELIELVKSTGPSLWKIARMQVYANIVQDGITIFVMLGICALLIRGARFARMTYEKNEREEASQHKDAEWDWAVSSDNQNDGYWFFMALAVAIGFVALVWLSSIPSRLVNPDYYAIKIIVDLVKYGGR